ncbi:hypothetical protein TrRE_jg1058 [Triparma retinervis]|uniref:Uncharacterized protein n=1 Tax=Triparma retinervis TaxID=2557542 RepID=A0A9W7F6X6_9STRA|nr:hypothetical protein TrRE_jg1058 [Triparma retinervis]
MPHSRNISDSQGSPSNSSPQSHNSSNYNLRRPQSEAAHMHVLEGSLHEVRLQNEGLLRHFSEAAEYKGKLTKALKKIKVLTKENSALAAEVKAMKVLQVELARQLKRSQLPGSPTVSPSSSILRGEAPAEKVESTKERNFKKTQRSFKYSLGTYKESMGKKKKYVQTSPCMSLKSPVTEGA